MTVSKIGCDYMDKEKYPNMKISIELGEDKRLSGRDLFDLLKYIDIHGSINKAASELGISYRYSWGLLKDAEKAMNTKLVDRQKGGPSGGGTHLTEEGKKLLQKYKTLNDEIDAQVKKIFQNADKDHEDSDSFATEKSNKYLLLASTRELVETGLLDVLEQAFFQETGIMVKHIAAGSGRALEIAKEGRVDMVLSHAPDLEDQFIKDGFGKFKKPIMTNNYIIVGPKYNHFTNNNDSVDIHPIDAFKKIAKDQVLFISRNDMSGTHLKEQELWEAAGITPEGQWYFCSSGLMGNLSVLQLAIEKNAYTLIDRATFLMAGAKDKMSIISDGTENNKGSSYLENIFSLILVNPSFMPKVHFQEASVFADWLTKDNTKNIIANFGIHTYGEPLFSVF